MLPVQQPVITSYSHFANMLSIVGREPTFDHWFVSEFIQLTGCRDPGTHSYFVAFIPDAAKQCPFVTKQVIEIDYALAAFGSLREFIIRSIDLHHYIEPVYDRYFIRNTRGFNRSHANHQMLISGYDLSRNIVQVTDFFRDGQFRTEEADLDEVAKAMAETHHIGTYLEEKRTVLTYRLNGHTHSYSNIRMRRCIQEFLAGVDSAQSLRQRLASDALGMVYGVHVYEEFASCLGDPARSENVLRSLHVLFDHGTALTIAARFLSEHCHLPTAFSASFLKACEDIRTRAFMTRNQYMMFLHAEALDISAELPDRVRTQGRETKAALESLLVHLTDDGPEAVAPVYTAKLPVQASRPNRR